MSILTFNISYWYKHFILTLKHKRKFSRITYQASKIIGSPQAPLSKLFTGNQESLSDQAGPHSTLPPVLPAIVRAMAGVPKCVLNVH